MNTQSVLKPNSQSAEKNDQIQREQQKAMYRKLDQESGEKYSRLSTEDRFKLFRELVPENPKLHQLFNEAISKLPVSEKDRKANDPFLESLRQLHIDKCLHEFGQKGIIFRRQYYHSCKLFLKEMQTTLDDDKAVKLLAEGVNKDLVKRKAKLLPKNKEKEKTTKPLYISPKEIREMMVALDKLTA